MNKQSLRRSTAIVLILGMVVTSAPSNVIASEGTVYGALEEIASIEETGSGGSTSEGEPQIETILEDSSAESNTTGNTEEETNLQSETNTDSGSSNGETDTETESDDNSGEDENSSSAEDGVRETEPQSNPGTEDNKDPDEDQEESTDSSSDAGAIEVTPSLEPSETDGPEYATEDTQTQYFYPEIQETVDTVNLALGDSYSRFRDYVEYVFFGDTSSEDTNPLIGCNALAYSKLKAHFKDVAEGKNYSSVIELSLEDLGLADKTWTAEDIGVEEIIENEAVSENAANALYTRIGLDTNLIVNTLLTNFPYLFFWFDQAGGVQISGLSLTASNDGSGWVLSIDSGLTVSFAILPGMAVSTDEVDPALGQVVSEAKEQADTIVSKYIGRSDFDILQGYKKDICSIVSNIAVSGTGNNPYVNTSQLLCVFDGNDTTNAASEGYAKAFQYLCDQTDFESDLISCITVTGTISGGTGEGSSMWNVVRMDDGKNYIADLSNCDEGTAGYPNLLWLAGRYGSDGKYEFSLDSGTLTYTYDSEAYQQYGYEYLELSGTDYSPAHQGDNDSDSEDVVARGICGESVYWKLSNDGVLTIFGQGPMWDYSNECVVGERENEVRKVVIEEGVTSIGDYSFYKTRLLEDISIPGSVTNIGVYAFAFCTSLTHITIPNTVSSVGDYCFYHCDHLKNVSVGKNLSRIGEHAFCNDFALESISVNKKNSYFSSVGGVLFNKSGTKLIMYTGRNRHLYKIPEGVTEIGMYAFEMSNLTAVIFPKTLTKLNGYAFSSCWNLEKITMYSKLRNINGFAFSDCSSLSDIYYYGTKNTWKKIKIQSGNENLTAARRHYLKTSLAKDSGKCGKKLKWSITSDGTLTITGSGKMQYYSEGEFPWENYRTAVRKLVIKKGITRITSHAFENLVNLKSVVIPDSVTTIENFAFSNCISLTSVKFGSHVKSIEGRAFAGCISLKKVTLPDSLSSFSSSALADCSSLSTIAFGKGLSKIKIDDDSFSVYSSGFGPMPALKSISVPASNTHYKTVNGVLFSKDGKTLLFHPCQLGKTYKVPGTVTTISNYAFRDSALLENITITSRVHKIGDQTFSGCANLKSVTFESYITEIGAEAFANCLKLETVNCKGAVNVIAHNAFYGDVQLKNINLSEGLETIDSGAFSGCAGLMELSLPEGLKTIGNEAFYECSSLRNVNLPDSIQNLGDSAFSECSRLTEIVIPRRLTAINQGVFYSCSNLKSVTLPSTLTSIGEYAFSMCRSLDSINCPDTITKIGNSAFSYCTSLGSVHIPLELKAIEESVFEGCKGLTVIDIPGNVKKIGDYAFAYSGLEEICMSAGIKSVGISCFAGTQIRMIVFPVTVETVKTQALADCDSLEKIIFLNGLSNVGSQLIYNSRVPEDVFYYGSADEYDGVLFGSGNDTLLDRVTIHDYTDYCADNGHSWNTHYTVDVPTTLTQTGVKSIHCSVCDIIKEESEAEAEMPLKHLVIENITPKAYTGNAIQPDVVIKHGDAVLKKGRDYVLSYQNNVLPGNATVTVKGIGDYTGTVKQTFLVKAAAPKLISAKNMMTTVGITWKFVNGVSMYRILRKTYNAKTKKWGKWEKVKDTPGGDGEFKYGYNIDNKPVNGKKYKYTVVCITPDGKTVVSDFNTKGKNVVYISPPSKDKATSPQSRQLKMTWKKSTTADGYEIEYSQDILHKVDNKVVKINDPAAVSWSVSGLASGTWYYCRIRKYELINGKKYYSSWSYNRSVLIK